MRRATVSNIGRVGQVQQVQPSNTEVDKGDHLQMKMDKEYKVIELQNQLKKANKEIQKLQKDIQQLEEDQNAKCLELLKKETANQELNSNLEHFKEQNASLTQQIDQLKNTTTQQPKKKQHNILQQKLKTQSKNYIQCFVELNQEELKNLNLEELTILQTHLKESEIQQKQKNEIFASPNQKQSRFSLDTQLQSPEEQQRSRANSLSMLTSPELSIQANQTFKQTLKQALGSPLIVELHKQIEIIRKQKRYVTVNQSEEQTLHLTSSLSSLKILFKELLSEVKELNQEWQRLQRQDQLNISDAIEIARTLAIQASSKLGSNTCMQYEDFVKLRDSFLQSLQENAQRVLDYGQISIDNSIQEYFEQKYGLDQNQSAAMISKYMLILINLLFYIIDLY